MDDGEYTIHIWPTDVPDPVADELTTVWHWKRLTENGAQVDGSGSQRHGSKTKKAVRALVKERYPDDKIVGG